MKVRNKLEEIRREKIPRWNLLGCKICLGWEPPVLECHGFAMLNSGSFLKGDIASCFVWFIKWTAISLLKEHNSSHSSTRKINLFCLIFHYVLRLLRASLLVSKNELFYIISLQRFYSWSQESFYPPSHVSLSANFLFKLCYEHFSVKLC